MLNEKNGKKLTKKFVTKKQFAKKFAQTFQRFIFFVLKIAIAINSLLFVFCLKNQKIIIN